jgi:hypothetical protein
MERNDGDWETGSMTRTMVSLNRPDRRSVKGLLTGEGLTAL